MWRRRRKTCITARSNDGNVDHRIVQISLENSFGPILELFDSDQGQVCLTRQRIIQRAPFSRFKYMVFYLASSFQTSGTWNGRDTQRDYGT